MSAVIGQSRRHSAIEIGRHRIGTTSDPMEELASKVVAKVPPSGGTSIVVLIDGAGRVYAGREFTNAIGITVARNPEWHVGTYTVAAPAARIAREIAMHLHARGDRADIARAARAKAAA